MSRKFGISIVLILAIAGTATWLYLRKAAIPVELAASSNQSAVQLGDPALVGIPTKSGSAPSTVAQPVAATKPTTVTAARDKNAAPALGDYVGRVKPVPGNTNLQVAGLVAALVNKNHPEMVSALAPAPPFDVADFRKDPDAYVNTVVPSRAFQTAQPGPGVSPLTPVGATQISMKQDGQVILRVLGEAGAPITATSFDLGRFSNQLVSQTVIADHNGIAAVSFSPGSGTISDVHIVIGSPMSSGSVTYVVTVTQATPTTPGHG
jgi:hypothetical protein